jgi:hypothetical protein
VRSELAARGDAVSSESAFAVACGRFGGRMGG